MKKRKTGRSLSRDKAQREALLSTLTVSLAKHQRISTTLAKAKELRPYAERMITHAKIAIAAPDKKIAKMRLLAESLPLETVKRLMKIAELFKDRNGGYIRILKLQNRQSDASPMALIEWVEKLPEQKAEKKSVVKKTDKKKAEKKSKDALKKPAEQAKPEKAEVAKKDESKAAK
jgi:large subunit ribosomal protein L17